MTESQQLISGWSSHSTVMTEVVDRWLTCGGSIGIIKWVEPFDCAERAFQNERLLYGVLGNLGRYGPFGIVCLQRPTFGAREKLWSTITGCVVCAISF